MRTLSGRVEGFSTPVPRREEKRAVNSEVITYKLSPEELAKYQNLKSPYEKLPVIVGQPVPKPQEAEEMSITKEQYLAKRKAGMIRSQIRKEAGVSDPTFYYWLAKWGLKDKAVEDQILAEMDEKKPATTEEVPRTPTQQEREELFEPEQVVQEPKKADVSNSELNKIGIHLQLPIILDPHGTHGLVVQKSYEQFGKNVDFASLDRGAVIEDLLHLNQAVISWLFADIKQLVVESEQVQLSVLEKLIYHHNCEYIDGIKKQAAENGWAVIGT